MSLTALPVRGVPEVRPGDDLAALLVAAATSEEAPGLEDGDVVVVTSKVVSKAEGRLVRGRARDEVVDEQTEQVVAAWHGPRGRTVIGRTRHGLVLAAAGVDASNVEPGTLVLLPEDPDASARRLRTGIRALTGANVGVVVSDTMGRAWRVGQTDAAIGAAGLVVLEDLRGTSDRHGNRLDVTVRAVGDEIAGLAELVAGKTSGVPAVVVRGLESYVLPVGDDGPGAATLVRPHHEDRFRLGTAEAMAAAVLARRTVRTFSDRPVPRDAVLRAVAAAATAPAPHGTTPWRFVLVETTHAREQLLAAMREQWVADLRGDGLNDEVIARHIRRGDLLWKAPALVVPCLAPGDGADTYADERRSSAERSMFVLSMGAATENLLVNLAADGWGTAWIGSSLFCPDVVRDHLALPRELEPMGMVAIGHPARQPAPRIPPPASGVVLLR